MSERPQNKHLKPFQKGHDPRRNVSGKNKVPDLKDVIQEVIGEEGMREIIIALYIKATQGRSEKAAEIFMDRVYGKAKQSLDVTSGGKPFIFELDQEQEQKDE